MKNERNNSEDQSVEIEFLGMEFGLPELLYFFGFVALSSFLFTFQLLDTDPYIKFFSWQKSITNVVALGATLICTLLYLSIRKSDELSERRMRIFVSLITILIFLTVKGADLVSLYLVPVAFGTALIAIFMDFETALSLNAVFAISVAVQAGFTGYLGPVIVAFVGGLVGILGAKEIRKSFDLTRIGISVGLVNMILIFAFRLPSMISPSWSRLDWSVYAWGGTNGLIAALFIAGAIPLAEFLTQRTSPIGLMELLNPSHPLLERLREEAPGTYHHSKNIASLGENAARAIGADPLLTAVGGYYHDIGKMVRPEFFIENQDPDSNPHDDLTPTMSKIVLTSHLKQGTDLGRSYGLKEDILHFIPTHHGTSVIRYFYLKALREQSGETDLAKEEFRYEAELPDTKETSIIALADSVEAASHGLQDVRTREVEDMIEDEIENKIQEGQLAESPLTMADIKTIKAEFADTIRAMSHNRISSFPPE